MTPGQTKRALLAAVQDVNAHGLYAHEADDLLQPPGLDCVSKHSLALGVREELAE